MEICRGIDSKRRVVLPERVRERLGIEPGSEVEIREEGGKAVVEPEDDPEDVLDRMEELIAETSPASEDPTPPNTDIDPVAAEHRDAVRRGALIDNAAGPYLSDIDGWDGYYAAVATTEGVNTVVTIDDDFEGFDEFDAEIVPSPEQFRELNRYPGN